ncbi:class I adenylate-forming enzyme family protein [Bacillus sp. CHD6a]|uniref:class I adenylate-forming enzyme family protein n=1 Tax=Bacillus sp. CHD6a TaxID=1643452 RepID=UPI0006CDFAA5|nr:long-chain fatty acid--CoA ligase [Bacillus sp. CHD6a]KPB04877.1 long-chain fatty acid--CoA ligase [Bacillus sp. CHD6a]
MEVEMNGSWLQKRSQHSPYKIAVIDGETGEKWNYKQMYDRSRDMAGRLLSAGVGAGDRVALLSPNHIVYFDLLFACREIGAIFVPINWRLAENEWNYIVRDCKANCVIVHDDYLEESKQLECQVFSLDELATKEMQKIGSPPTRFHDAAAIIYTGGTTGHPKGVILTNENITWNAINTIVSWGLHGEDTTLTCLPMFHTGGLNALSTPLLMAGGTVVLMRSFDSEKAIKLLNLYKCTITLMVPTMYSMLIEHPHFHGTDFPTMKTFLSGGAPCPLEIYEAFYQKGKLFKEGYGLTEAGPNNFYIDPYEAYGKKGSVGKAMLFNEVKLMVNDSLEATEEEVGEIYIRGSHVFSEYWEKEEETKKVKRDGWLRTGDLGRRDEEGYFYIVGRTKDMIISGGENVYPLEVEQILCQHEAVKEACVIGVPHPVWGEAVIAIVSSKRQTSERELLTFCKSRIGVYKIPKKIVFVPEIPKTAVGKLDKKNLQNSFRNLYAHNQNKEEHV